MRKPINMGLRRTPLVKCPKCGEEGGLTIMKVKRRSEDGLHFHYYLTIVHSYGRKCTLVNIEKILRNLEKVRGQP